METESVHAAPAFVLGADLRAGAVVTVSRLEAWSSVAVLIGAVVLLFAGSGAAVWFAANGA